MELTYKTVGPYEIKEEVGRGGTAVVYNALDRRNNKEVALKVLLPQFATDTATRRRFIKEGQNAVRLQHENIVRVYESGQIGNDNYIAMELVRGCTLSEYLTQRNSLLDVDEAIDVLSQIAAGLDFAHSLGFLHRDIKLGNILMADDGRILLSDFGAAKHMYRDNTLITAVGHTIGTPSYMSPEQVTGAPIDGRSDVYSLGVIAYKLFTGRLPFRAHSQPELLHKIAYEEPVAPESINEELPYTVVNALRNVLTKDPAQRYESAGTFVATLVAGRMWKTNATTPKPLTGQVQPQYTKPKSRTYRKRLARLSLAATACIVVYLLVWAPENALRTSVLHLDESYRLSGNASFLWAIEEAQLSAQLSELWSPVAGQSSTLNSRKSVAADISLLGASEASAALLSTVLWQTLQSWGNQMTGWVDGLGDSDSSVFASVAPSSDHKPSIPTIAPKLFPKNFLSAIPE